MSKDFQVLPLTRLKRARRSLLGKIEYAGVRFIITDYGEAVAELGPLSKSAEQFMAHQGSADQEDSEPQEEERRRSGT